MIESRKLAEYSIIFMALCLGVYLLNVFSSFLRPFVVAVILVFLFVPFTRLSSKRRWNIYLGTFFSVFVLILGFVGVGALVSDSDVDSQGDLGFSDKILELVSTEYSFFGNSFSLSSVVDPEKVKEIFAGTFGAIFNSTTTFLSELFLIILFVSFLLPMHDKWVERVKASFRNVRYKKKFADTVELIEQSIRDYLYVKSIVSLGTAGLSFIFMILFGVKYAAVFALMIFALNFIPNIGSIAAVGVVLLSHFINAGAGLSLVMLSVVLILVQIIFGNVVEPKFAGNKLDVSPVLILLALFFWGAIWGIGGMLFSVPLTVIIKIFYQKFIVED